MVYFRNPLSRGYGYQKNSKNKNLCLMVWSFLEMVLLEVKFYLLIRKSQRIKKNVHDVHKIGIPPLLTWLALINNTLKTQKWMYRAIPAVPREWKSKAKNSLFLTIFCIVLKQIPGKKGGMKNPWFVSKSHSCTTLTRYNQCYWWQVLIAHDSEIHIVWQMPWTPTCSPFSLMYFFHAEDFGAAGE